MAITKGSKIQSGPGHRFAVVTSEPVTGTVVRVVDDGHAEVEWDSTTLNGRRKVLANSVESVDELELVEAATAARPRRTVAATGTTAAEAAMAGNNPARDAIEESLTFAASEGLIRSWKRLPVQAQAKWEVVVHPSAHAAKPADVCVIRTYAEAQLFAAALMSARSGIMSKTAAGAATSRRTTWSTRRAAQEDGPRIPAALTEMSRKELRRWATVYAQRDDMIDRANRNGVGVNEISRITTLAKTTVLRILHPGEDQ